MALKLGLLSGVLQAAACGDAMPTTGPLGDGGEPGGTPRLCVALRGNGHYIVTHFASLARLVESYGPVDAASGGSSGTVTMFLYESMAKNPALGACGGSGPSRSCAEDEYAARFSLLLKSVQGYGEAVGRAWGYSKLVELLASEDIGAKLASDPSGAAAALERVLSPTNTETLAFLVNQKLLAKLRETDPDKLRFNVREVHDAISAFGAFAVDDNRLFFRPGLIDWDYAPTVFGRAADFYSAYGPADLDGMRRFLDACAQPARGKPWPEVASLDVKGESCGKRFGDVADAWRKAAEKGGFPSRLDEPIGGSFRAVAITSILTGDLVRAYEAARLVYDEARSPVGGRVPFQPRFSDVRFGAWGRAEDIERIAENRRGFTDAKSAKFMGLGTTTWRDVLSASPAEPGLSEVRKTRDGHLSAGGWADLHPVQVLANLGCERTVYVTRQSPESMFTVRIAEELGMSPDEGRALFDLGNAESGFATAVRSAAGIWCTNWNAFTDFQVEEMANDAYSAPLETTDPFFGVGPSPYAARTSRTGLPGCTPGVVGP